MLACSEAVPEGCSHETGAPEKKKKIPSVGLIRTALQQI